MCYRREVKVMAVLNCRFEKKKKNTFIFHWQVRGPQMKVTNFTADLQVKPHASILFIIQGTAVLRKAFLVEKDFLLPQIYKSAV